MTENPDIFFGRSIRERRETRGWSLETLAGRIGLKPRTLQQIESGHQACGKARRVVIEQALSGGNYSEQPTPAAEVRDDPPPWSPPPAAAGPPLDRVAAIVADESVQKAAAAMIGAGIAPATAWRAILEAKLRETTK